MSPKIRIIIGILLSIISGIFLTIAFSPYNQWYLIFIAFIPMSIAQYRIFPEKYSVLASGIMNMLWLALYFGPMFFFTPGSSIYMKLLPLIGFILPLITEKGYPLFNKTTGYRWFVFHGIANWIWFEFIRTLIPGLGTWGFVGYTLWNQTWLIFPSSIFGIYGLSFLIMFVNFSLSAFIISIFDNRLRFDDIIPLSNKKGKIYVLSTIILLFVWSISGIIIKNIQEESIKKQDTIRVAAIQPGKTEVAFSHPDMDKKERVLLISELIKKASQEKPNLIVLPELFFNFDPEKEHSNEFIKLASDTQAYLVLAYGLLEDNNATQRNEVKVLTPDGKFLPLYSKTHPVAFAGEKRGPNWGNFPIHITNFGKLANMICYDLNYTDVTRIFAKKGAQIIGVPSNDWPGIVGKQNIHLVFRAIENNVALVKAENAYQSAIISPLGEIIEEYTSKTPSQAILINDVPLGTGKPTLYSYLGDIIGYIFFALGFIFMFIEGYVKKIIKIDKLTK